MTELLDGIPQFDTRAGGIGELIIAGTYLFAYAAHAGQLRKVTGLPYIVHPLHVAEIVFEATGDVTHVIAALLHDTVEDTTITIEDIYRLFTEEAAVLVEGLTDPEQDEYETKPEYKERCCNRILEQSQEVQLIKCADILSNTSDIEHQPDHWVKAYCNGKLKMVKQMNNALSTQTQERLESILNNLGVTNE